MKKILLLLLSAVLVYSSVGCVTASAADAAYGSYQRVVILGVDGAGAFFDDTDTPACDRIFSEKSAVTNTAKSEFITISAQNWGAMLLGVSYSKHGLTNEITDSVQRTSDEKYPSIFRLTREAYPDATLASFCNWSNISRGIIENDIGVYTDSASDSELCDKITSYLAVNDPKLLFVQFDSVDHYGHSNGYGSEEHLNALSVVDGYIGEIYDCLDSLGRIEDTLFIVVSDHGGTPGVAGGGGSHGGRTAAEYTVFLGVRGKNVNPSDGDFDARNRDVAAIALYALGIPATKDMTAEVPSGMFDGTYSNSLNIFERIIKAMKDFIEKIKLFFEGFGGC